MSNPLNLFPARVRFVHPDGTLTAEALRMLQTLVSRVGGALGDTGDDLFASADPVPGVVQDVIQQPASDAAAELVQQDAPYRAGTALGLADYRFSLKDTAVVPETYGSASSVAKFTVDQQGRLTFAENVPIAINATQVSGLGTMAAQNIGTNFTGSFTGKTVTVANGIITQVV